jgi:hypothetical protein
MKRKWKALRLPTKHDWAALQPRGLLPPFQRSSVSNCCNGGNVVADHLWCYLIPKSDNWSFSIVSWSNLIVLKIGKKLMKLMWCTMMLGAWVFHMALWWAQFQFVAGKHSPLCCPQTFSEAGCLDPGCIQLILPWKLNLQSEKLTC